MKLCGAYGKMLGKGSYSKKQWQLNREQQRRCKECVAANKEVQPLIGVTTDTDPTTATQVVVPTIGYLSLPGPETHEQKERRVLGYRYLSNGKDIPRPLHGKKMAIGLFKTTLRISNPIILPRLSFFLQREVLRST